MFGVCPDLRLVCAARFKGKLSNQVGNDRFLLMGCGSHPFQTKQESLLQLASVGKRVQMFAKPGG
jgi:hypothetical protein